MKPWPIDRVLLDERFLGAGLGDASSWSTWLSVLRAAFGLELSDADRQTFREVAGGRELPAKRVREFWAIIGRGGGKSRVAAALSVFLAMFQRHKLAPGEVGHVLVLAASRDQAAVVFGYVLGFLRASGVLAREIESETASEVRLRNGVVIGVHANSFRTVRGRTLLACVFDEVSMWRDDTSASPDIETYRAVLPSLARTGGMLVAISTPYRRTGLLYAKHRDHFGVDSDGVLVVQGASQVFNATIGAELIEQAIAADPEAGRSEWEAQFRSDISAFLDDALIDRAVEHGRPAELPPRSLVYKAFADPSGGRGDAYTLCIGHREPDGRVVCDVIRGKRPPLDPAVLTREYAQAAKEYGCREIVTDNYSAEWVAGAFKEAGLRHRRADMAKSALYLEGLPLFARGLVSLPDNAKLLRELRLLERRTHRSGKDSVDHPRAGSDDHANALFGMLRLCTGKFDPHEGMPHWWRHMQTSPEGDAVARAWRDARLERETAAEAAARRNVEAGSMPCTVDWAALQRERELPEGLTRKQIGTPRIW